MRIRQGGPDLVGRQGAQAVERAQGLHPRLGQGAVPATFARTGTAERSAAMDEEPLDVVAHRAVAGLDRGGQLGSREPLEVRARGPRGRPSATTR